MFQSILVPIDGSEPSARVVSLALQLARLTKARVLLAHVIESETVVERAEAPFLDPDKVSDGMKRDGAKVLSDTLASSDFTGIAVESLQIEGEPVEAIVRIAEEHACDLIVMGSHGRGGLQRFFLGGVTEGVLRHTHVPVLCVRAELPAP